MARHCSSILAAMTAVLGGTILAAAPLALPLGAVSSVCAMDSTAQEELDKLVLRNGRVIEGRVLSETAESVRFEVIVGTMRAAQTYKKDTILEIVRADRPAGAAEDAGEAADMADEEDKTPLISASTDALSVYVIELEGIFGRDIAPTPVRQAVEAARKEQPDFLVVYLNNDWSYFGGEIPSDYQDNFDWFMVAEKLVPIFTHEIDLNWEMQPTLVFWVRNAMGGAAFLPFVADKIYMHPEGRIGGVGTLEQMFEGTGDEVVRQKQRSLRLGMAQGVAIEGGYDYRLITAMARRSYVLCYDVHTREMFERMPQSTSERVLTDDGKGENKDTMRQLVTGEGDDVLTLTPDIALDVDVSSGTAADLDELLEHLGILRNHNMIEGRSTRILEQWKKSVTRAEREIPRLWEDYNEVQGGGDPAEQRRAISTRIRILKDIQNLYRRYGEAFNPFAGGVPAINNIDMMIEELEIQIMLIED